MAAKVNMKTKTAALALALAQAVSIASGAEPDPLDVLRRALQQRHIAAEPAQPQQGQTQKQKPVIALESPDDYRMLEKFMPDYKILIAQAQAVQSPDESPAAEPDFEIIEKIQLDYQTLIAEAVALEAEPAGAEQTAQAQPKPTTEPEIIHIQTGPWPEEPANPARRELWSETITLEPKREKTPSQSELQRTIARLRSVRFDSPAEREPRTEPEPQQPEPEEPQVAQARPGTSQRQISDQTLGQLAKLADEDAQIEQPLKIAELLYRDGHKQLAGRYYEIALAQSETMTVQDRAWALFQLGNCLREQSPEKAIQAYKQLVSEHPRTTWARAAAARIEVLEFHQQNQPEMTASSHRAN